MDAYKYSNVDENGDPIFRREKSERGLFTLLRRSQTFQKLSNLILTSDKVLIDNITETNEDIVDFYTLANEFSSTTFFTNNSSISMPILNSSYPSLRPIRSSFPNPNSSKLSTQPSIESLPSPSMQPSIQSLTQSSIHPTVRNSNSPSLLPTERHSISPSIQESFLPSVQKQQVTVGVYYYPWYAKNFHGGKYLREFLVPPQYPSLSEYSDRDSSVISKHIEWSKDAGISLWVCSWWGPNSSTDITIREMILRSNELKNANTRGHMNAKPLKVAIHYETVGRTDDFMHLSNVRTDIQYIARNFFQNENYYRIDNKPVIVIYLTRVLSANNCLCHFLRLMRKGAKDAGFPDIYIVGDQVFGPIPYFTDQKVQDISLLDAITDYDVYGSIAKSGYADAVGVNKFYNDQNQWRNVANLKGVGFIPIAAPGYNDRGVRDGHLPLSRKLNALSDFGSLFDAMLKQAMKQLDPKADNLILINSFNEWHEDTQIEPVTDAKPTSFDISFPKSKYTKGYAYEGYEFRYLDILRETVASSREQ